MSNLSNKMITVNARIYFNEKIYKTSSQPSPTTTTLGLIGETIKGPAFHPFYITNDFKAQPTEVFNRLFGGTSSEKYIENGMLRYELSYIANNFLTESNQLFVTRVLGLTGYNAGKAWAIKLQTSNDTSTNVRTTTGAVGFSSLETAFVTIGDGLTDTEAAAFYTAVQKYQTTLGRQV